MSSSMLSWKNDNNLNRGSTIERSSFSIETKMRMAFLPPGLFSKGVICDGKGRPAYDLDIWPRELINASKSFMLKTDGELFHEPDGEAYAENDAITNRYCIDFKFILGNSAQHAVKETAAIKVVVAKGLTFSSSSKSQGERLAVRIHAALRECSLDRLRELAHKDPRRECADMVDRDISYLARSIHKDKNLLLILPILLYADDGAVFSASDMNRMVNSDFKQVFTLRRELHPSKETYLGFFHEGKFYIAQARDGELVEFDAVEVRKSAAFMEILCHYDKWDYSLFDRLVGEFDDG